MMQLQFDEGKGIRVKIYPRIYMVPMILQELTIYMDDSPYHAEGYSRLVANHAKRDYSCDRSKCSTMPSVTIVT